MFMKYPWSSAFIYGVTVLVLSWGLTACRFGTKEENNDRLLYSCQAGWTGFYETKPQELAVCAVFDDSNEGGCILADLSMLPNSELIDFLTNPVGVQVSPTPGQTSAFIAKTDLEAGYPTLVDPVSGEIMAQVDRGTFPLLSSDPNCQEASYDTHYGQLSREAGRPVDDILTCGSLSGTMIQGADYSQCETSLTQIANCYANAANCGGMNRDDVIALFGLYVESGAVTLQDLPRVKGLFYGVTYAP